MGIRDNRYTVDVPTVTGPLSSPQPVHLEEVQFINAGRIKTVSMPVEVMI